jgi:membrane protease YdiL (CAAX protease family)
MKRPAPGRGHRLGAVAAGAATLGYSALLNRVLPPAVHVPGNLTAGAALATGARQLGVSVGDLGLAPRNAGRGARIGALVGVPIVGAIATAATRPSTQPLFADHRVRRLTERQARYEAAIRIPLGTALGEELIFRGALFGLLRRRHSTLTAVAVSSIVFGFWHVLPAIDGLHPRDEETRVATHVAGTVAATTAAGVGFCVLRLWSGSIIAPAIVHAMVNTSAFVAARATDS